MKTESLNSIKLDSSADIINIGTDVEEICRFHKHFDEQGRPDQLILDIYTEEEIKRNSQIPNKVLCFSAGFSCKEAVFKALGRSWMNAMIGWQDIELLFEADHDLKNFKIRVSPVIWSLISQAGASNIVGRLHFNDEYVTFDVVLTT